MIKKISDIFDPPQENESILGDKPLLAAISRMTSRKFSQLLVVKQKINGQIKKSQVLGCVSWNSIGKAINEQGVDLNSPVKNYLELVNSSSKFLFVKSDETITDVAKKLMEQEYVVAYDSNDTILGFITAYDIAKLYLDMVMPYTDIQKIEMALRKILSKRLSIDEIKAASKTEGHDREFDDVKKMEFSEYITVVRKKWDALGIRDDKDEFLSSLEEIRRIRNKIMHFNAEKISSGEQKLLNGFGEKIESIAAKIPDTAAT